MNARRQKVENQIRKEELESIRYKSRAMVLVHKPDMDAIHKIAYPENDEKIKARFELLRANKKHLRISHWLITAIHKRLGE
jgi:hypothetical protein